MPATNKIKIDISWSSDHGFTMDAKFNQEPNVVIIHVDHSACTEHYKAQIAEICNSCFSRAVQRALDELKQEG